MRFRDWLSAHVTIALKDLLRMSAGKDPVPQCWRCEAGVPRTYDGFHQKRPGVYAKCLSPPQSAEHQLNTPKIVDSG